MPLPAAHPPTPPPGSWMLPWHGFLSSSNSPGILTSFQRHTVTVFKEIPAKILTKEENHFCLFPSGLRQPTPPAPHLVRRLLFCLPVDIQPCSQRSREAGYSQACPMLHTQTWGLCAPNPARDPLKTPLSRSWRYGHSLLLLCFFFLCKIYSFI